MYTCTWKTHKPHAHSKSSKCVPSLCICLSLCLSLSLCISLSHTHTTHTLHRHMAYICTEHTHCTHTNSHTYTSPPYYSLCTHYTCTPHILQTNYYMYLHLIPPHELLYTHITHVLHMYTYIHWYTQNIYIFSYIYAHHTPWQIHAVYTLYVHMHC